MNITWIWKMMMMTSLLFGIRKQIKNPKAELSKADLFDYIEPWDHANWG